jgi:hypothetical protein
MRATAAPVHDVDLPSTPGCATLWGEMCPSSPLPPGDGKATEAEALDELDMTSVMGGAQTRELLKALRLASEAERETTKPPPGATGSIEVEVAIPVASAVPRDAGAIPVASAVPRDAGATPEPAPIPAPPLVAVARSRVVPPVARASMSWAVVAFVLLAAAIAFELR